MRANKILLLISSLLTLGVLVFAAYQENVQRDWRRLQEKYRSALPPESSSEFVLQLRQIVVPAMGTTDRCVTCHLGMAPGETPIEGDRVFVRHPQVGHDPAEFGCVVCHGGQGRATDEDDAHGHVEHWPAPMVPRGYAFAGCGTCHTHLAVPNLAQLERGRDLFERYDCLACHRIDGRGGTTRPGAAAGIDGGDLSRSGIGDGQRGWYEAHVEKRRSASSGPWRDSFGEIPAGDLAAVRTYLESRVGAPGLVESKALFHSRGCRGCHKLGGVGGDDGPDLTRVGEKDPGRLDFTHVPEPRSLPSWLAEHFRAPASVVPGSAMPVLGLSEEEIRTLVFYMMSLRRSNLPEAYWPKDRIRAERFAEREFATDGATLYGSFCAACHGPRGEGMRYPGMNAFPAIGNPDFLQIASDTFITETVHRGRPGRRMPAWGEKEGGLRPDEVKAVVGYLRGVGGGGPGRDVDFVADTKPARWVKADAGVGARLFADNCAVCHGERGEGKEGTALSSPVLLQSASDTYLVETIRRGRRDTSMPAFLSSSTTHRMLSELEIEAVVAFIRTWEVKP